MKEMKEFIAMVRRDAESTEVHKSYRGAMQILACTPEFLMMERPLKANPVNNLQQYREALERARIMATEAYLYQDGKSIVAASDFKEIEILLENALKGDK